MNCSGVKAPSLHFTSATLSIVVCYLLVFLLALIGNSAMFLILFRNQWIKRRRVHSLLLHMTVAHLLVTLIYMPKEIIHNVTVAWWGGDLLCRICKFFDVFGVALSAGILMCLSLDRFYSILFPLYVINAKKSVTRMLTVAWTVSLISSLPQIYIFRTAKHPCFNWYTQCVSADVIGMVSPKLTFWFSVLNILQVYFIPLLVILICYGSILISISLKTRSTKNEGLCYFWNKSSSAHVPKDKKKSMISKNCLTPNCVVVNTRNVVKSSGTVCDSTLRRTGGGDSFQRAKNRTLKMTIVLVLAFLLCWTPYTVAMFIHFLHASSTLRPIPPLLSKFLYAFAVFNSALSPYLYGYFSFNIREEIKLLLYCCSKPSCFNSASSGSPHSSQSAFSARERRRIAIRQKTSELSSISSTMAHMPNNSSGTALSKSRFLQQQRISSISDRHQPNISHLQPAQKPKNLSFQLDGARTHQPSPLSIAKTEQSLNKSYCSIPQEGEVLEVSVSNGEKSSLTEEEGSLLKITTTNQPLRRTQSQSPLLLTDDDVDNCSNTSSNAGGDQRSQSFTINNNNSEKEEEEEEFNTNTTAKQPLLLSPKGMYRNAIGSIWKHTAKSKEEKDFFIVEKEVSSLN